MKASLKRLASGYKLEIVLPLILDNKLTLRVGKSDSKSLGLWLTLTNISSSVPNPASVRANVGRQLHVRDNCKPY